MGSNVSEFCVPDELGELDYLSIHFENNITYIQNEIR